MNKIAIIGNLETNKSIARLIINHNLNLDQVVFINEKQENIDDFLCNINASFFKENDIFKTSDYSCLNDSTMLVILDGNIDDIIKKSIDNNFSGIYIVGVDDVNIICNKIYSLTNVPTYKIIGIGCMSECNHISSIISEKLKISKKNINIYVIGDKRNYVIPYYISNIGVLKIYDCFSDDELESITSDFNSNFDFNVSRLDSIIYLIDVMVNDKREILSVSSYDMETGIYLSQMSIVDKFGVRDVIKLDLDEEDTKSINYAIDCIKKDI